MSQTVMDPQSRVPAAARASASPGSDSASYPRRTARPSKSNGLSITALVSALVAIGLAAFPLVVSGVARGIAIGMVSAGLVLGVLAAVLGVLGRGRAVSKGLGMACLVLSILALAWTIGGFACTVW